MSAPINVPAERSADRSLQCPLCRAVWIEHAGARQRGACPGCGAGEGEMFRALSVKYAKMLEAGRALRTSLNLATESAAKHKADLEVLRSRRR